LGISVSVQVAVKDGVIVCVNVFVREGEYVAVGELDGTAVCETPNISPVFEQ
jgi:hypothetical protein